jgi:hypothetical protein
MKSTLAKNVIVKSVMTMISVAANDKSRLRHKEAIAVLKIL